MQEQSCAVPPKALRAALSSEKSPRRQAALAEQFPQCTSSQLKAKHWGKGVIM